MTDLEKLKELMLDIPKCMIPRALDHFFKDRAIVGPASREIAVQRAATEAVTAFADGQEMSGPIQRLRRALGLESPHEGGPPSAA